MRFKNMINGKKDIAQKVLILILVILTGFFALYYYSTDVTIYRKQNELYTLEHKFDTLQCELGRYMEKHGRDGAAGLVYCSDKDAAEIIAMGREFSEKFAE